MRKAPGGVCDPLPGAFRMEFRNRVMLRKITD